MTADLLALLDELDAAREKSTPGPWVHNPTNGIHTPIGSCVATTHRHENAERRADAAAIVAAVNNLPKLTAALRAALDLAAQCEQEAAAVDQALGLFSRHDGVHMEMSRAASAKRDMANRIRTALKAGVQEES
jgi:hypothetical protein